MGEGEGKEWIWKEERKGRRKRKKKVTVSGSMNAEKQLAGAVLLIYPACPSATRHRVHTQHRVRT